MADTKPNCVPKEETSLSGLLGVQPSVDVSAAHKRFSSDANSTDADQTAHQDVSRDEPKSHEVPKSVLYMHRSFLDQHRSEKFMSYGKAKPILHETGSILRDLPTGGKGKLKVLTEQEILEVCSLMDRWYTVITEMKDAMQRPPSRAVTFYDRFFQVSQLLIYSMLLKTVGGPRFRVWAEGVARDSELLRSRISAKYTSKDFEEAENMYVMTLGAR